jgi:glutamate synthase domain-containing protein 2/glutamate synthase domain-containing protein 1/glutamate synthase domain-containing protein 3
MTNDGAPQRTNRNRLSGEPPLYDARYEHDACGVGFVADAGGRSSARILALALGGLGALGHRGAFAADGASSDGAGVLLPLTPSLLRVLDPGAVTGERPGVLTVFAPVRRRGAPPETAPRAIVEAALAAEGLPAPVWRRVPLDPAALGREAAASLPVIEQALIARPAALAEPTFELALACARRRADAAARSLGVDGFAVVSASSRTVVYKGLVAGGRLAQLYPDLGSPIDVPFAMFHQRYATNTSPVWSLAQPFAFVAHNGEINTVRGNREAVRGRRDDAGIPGRRREAADRLRAAGPLLSPGVSDSRSLDEALELLVATGWSLESALLALVPEATALRRTPHPAVAAFRRRVAGFVAPWDGPGAFVFSDGRRVGALLDRNGLRPAAWSLTADRIVAVASEAGAVPLSPAEIVRTGRLAPGELLLVDPPAGRVLTDADAKSWVLRRLPLHDAPREVFVDGDGAIGIPVIEPASTPEAAAPDPGATTPALRYLVGLDAEKLRLDVRTMALDAHEPLWSMGDDTPLTGRGRVTRPVSDHLRQAFAQVTNPPIDPERERAVMDLQMELGRRPALLGGMPLGAATVRVGRPVVVDLEGLLDAVRVRSRAPHRAVRSLDASWPSAAGTAGLEDALDRLGAEALEASRGGAEVVVLSDVSAALDDGRLPVPSVLAAGAVHTALAEAGLRGRTDVVIDAGDVLDVHGLAMVVAAGARVVHPRLLLELVREQAGSRGAEHVTRDAAVANVLTALDAGLRKVLARMGISTVASYVGGQLFETLELGPDLVARCFPAAAAWPGRLEAADLASVQLVRLDEARALASAARPDRLPDPGFARFRSDGELHLYSPSNASALETLAATGAADPVADVDTALETYRAALRRDGALVRDGFRVRRPRAVPAVPLEEVEDARSIARRFVVSAMSVGALSPEAHRVLTLGIQALGGAANTGEGGEDPAWYAPGPDGRPTDAKIKQVASARFGVTAEYLARADQLEIKMAQGSKPGEGGQLPGRKVTAYIASLRRAQPGQALISPPPHHDIYSIEDLAQLIADLRAINPTARIGVKLVATRGVGTIASGVTKAGADYIHLSGHAGGTGASPLSSIKHVGAPWELGLSEVHQSLLRNDLRDRVALRTDGGLQTGHDLLIAALLGAEEFAFGTGALVAVGCDMARQCHLDTCPTGIATQREDLRAKFTGTPEMVVAFFLRIAEDLRRSLAAVGARSVGEVVGEGRRFLREAPGSTIDLSALLSPAWTAGDERRAAPWAASRGIERQAASGLESRLVAALAGQDGGLSATGLRVTTAERSFGAALTGAIRRGELRAPVELVLGGAAGQSFGAWAGDGVSLVLEGTANDYVGKGLSGGHLVVRPAPEMVAGAALASAGPASFALAGNTCLYGATGGRLHVVGRAGMRFAIRNSGAEAVVEGLGPHGCEYMTGGTVVVLGPVGQSFGAGMTGGRAYLWDPSGRHVAALHAASVRAVRLSEAAATRDDGPALTADLDRLLRAHRDARSALAARLVDAGRATHADVWLVEPVPVAPAVVAPVETALAARPVVPSGAAGPQPNRNRAVA